MKMIKLKTLLVAVFFIVGLVGCAPHIEQDVNFSKYDRNGEEIYNIYTYVWGNKDMENFMQWSDSDRNIKKENIENIKAKQMKAAKKELAKLLEYQTTNVLS